MEQIFTCKVEPTFATIVKFKMMSYFKESLFLEQNVQFNAII